MWKRPWTVLFAGFVLVTLAAGVYVLTTRAVELGIWAQQGALEYVLPEHQVFETDRGEVHRRLEDLLNLSRGGLYHRVVGTARGGRES